MQERTELAVREFVAHEAAVEADIVPVGRVIEWRALLFSDLAEQAVAVHFVHWNSVQDLDLLGREAVPVIKEGLRFFVVHLFGAAGAGEVLIISLRDVVGVLEEFPLLFGLESLGERCVLFFELLDLAVDSQRQLLIGSVDRSGDPAGKSVAVLDVCLAELCLVTVELHVGVLDSFVEIGGRVEACQFFKFVDHHVFVLLVAALVASCYHLRLLL